MSRKYSVKTDFILLGSLVSISGNPEVEKVRHRETKGERERSDWDSNSKGTEMSQGGGMDVEGEGSGCHRIVAGWESVKVICYTLRLSGRRLGCLVDSGSGIFHLPSLFVAI